MVALRSPCHIVNLQGILCKFTIFCHGSVGKNRSGTGATITLEQELRHSVSVPCIYQQAMLLQYFPHQWIWVRCLCGIYLHSYDDIRLKQSILTFCNKFLFMRHYFCNKIWFLSELNWFSTRPCTLMHETGLLYIAVLRYTHLSS